MKKYSKRRFVGLTDIGVDFKSNINIKRQVNVISPLKGLHWFMHEHDDDINDPSCPHCHAKEKHWKLDIYTGYMYEYPGKRYKGKLSKSDMRNMWSQKNFLDLVIKERLWYEMNYQKIDPVRYPKLPPLPIKVKHRKAIFRISKKWMNSNQKEMFMGVRQGQEIKFLH